jgi:hypothetical protein
MAEVLVETQGGPLTDDDFEADAPPPGSSDARYSPEALALMDEVAAEVLRELEKKEATR